MKPSSKQKRGTKATTVKSFYDNGNIEYQVQFTKTGNVIARLWDFEGKQIPLTYERNHGFATMAWTSSASPEYDGELVLVPISYMPINRVIIRYLKKGLKTK